VQHYLAEFGISIWETPREISPYLLFGFLVAGLPKAVESLSYKVTATCEPGVFDRSM
jgi:hypothetical protein